VAPEVQLEGTLELVVVTPRMDGGAEDVEVESLLC
jgi:hypothetical protein